MTVYLVKRQPVYIPFSRMQELKEELLKEKSAQYRVASIIAGSRENEETSRIIRQFLLAEYEKDPSRFYSEWVKFNIVGEEASKEIWPLLHCYCLYYGYASLVDLRTTMNVIMDNLHSTDMEYPMGKAFILEHQVRPARWWWKYTHRMANRKIQVLIIPKLAYRLAGELKDFTIYTKSLRIKCEKKLFHISNSISENVAFVNQFCAQD